MLLFVLTSASHAANWVGSDLGGADLILLDRDTLVGTFTGVGRLEIPFGASVLARDLVVDAVEVVIDGELVADGAGEPGGYGDGAGDPATGPLGQGGGGGAGHAGLGGRGSDGMFGAGARGGSRYGDPALPLPERGSGGGAGSELQALGGAGGGSVELRASRAITLGATARIGADGADGSPGGCGAAAGGGSGGSIRLEAPALELWGTVSARGGAGGDGIGCSDSVYYGTAGFGGGGGGGRIAIDGVQRGAPSVDVDGGAGGIADGGYAALSPGAPGAEGTYDQTGDDGSEPIDPSSCEAGDDDADGVCNDVDACHGADRTGDADGDGWCAADIIGNVADCDDADPARHPGAVEVCNGRDDACIGRPPVDEEDLDDDGIPICSGDCDDLDPTRQDNCDPADPAPTGGCGCNDGAPQAGWAAGLVLLATSAGYFLFASPRAKMLAT